MTAVDEWEASGLATRTPPSDPHAERSVLGAAMASPDGYTAAVEAGLTASDFHDPGHENTWAAITALSERGEPYGPVSVVSEMRANGTLRSLTDPSDLARMFGSVSDAAHHSRLLMELAARRRAITAGIQLIQLGYAANVPAADLMAGAMGAVESIAVPTDESTWSMLDDVLEMVADAAPSGANAAGITWGGLTDVDKAMAPLVPGEFAVIAAYSGGGKSVAACGMALPAAVHQEKRVLVHAMEMTRLEVGQRWVAAEAHVQLEDIIAGRVTAADQWKIDRAYARMVGAPLVIDEVETVTLAALRASIRKHRPEFVVVDQIPTMTPTDTRMPREQQVSAIAYGLKRLAKSESVPILACSQLNANATRRADRSPTMHDLRESLGIVHAANTVVILAEPEGAADGKEDPRSGEIDWIIRKQRQGRKDVSIPLARLFHYGKLGDLA